MNNIIDKEYFIIRSRETELDVSLPISADRKFDHVAVSSLSIPKSFYVLPTNAILEIKENNVIKNITFEKGNYNYKSFQTIFKNKLLAEPSLEFKYSITFPNPLTQIDTEKFTYTVTQNHNSQPSFRINNQYLAGIMGFEINTWYDFILNSLTSEHHINFQSYDEILIKSDMVRNQASLLQEVYSNEVPYGGSISYKCDDILISSKLLKPNTTNIYHFSVLDSNGVSIDLNGSEWSMIICLFRISNIDEVIKKYIEIRMLEKDLTELQS